MSKSGSWFEVDRGGLRKILADRGPAFILHELLSNAWDTSATRVDVTVEPIARMPRAVIRVVDDHPDGFADLAHAFTLYADSAKKGDIAKRGRFNVGEKLVLAMAESAMIRSTRGTWYFDAEGRRPSRERTTTGSVFEGTFRMTAAEVAMVEAAVARLIVPVGITTTFNGVEVAARPEVASFEARLPTVIADGEGYLRNSSCSTRVTLHEVLPGETAQLYEMGVPVVETGDRWHVNVGQKVPLNADRDNVPPSYLRRLRVAVLNAMAEELPAEEASAPWVREAASDKACAPEAITKVIDLRFGEKRVIADPTDPEGTKIAVSQGYQVIHGGALSAGEWANVKAAGAALPAGQVTPSPKPFAPEGAQATIIPPEQWTPAMKCRVRFAVDLARELLGASVAVDILNDKGVPASATYGKVDPEHGHMTLNLARLGHRWFAQHQSDPKVMSLLIHEFAHHESGDHLSSEFHKACCLLGAKAAELALDNPAFFFATR